MTTTRRLTAGSALRATEDLVQQRVTLDVRPEVVAFIAHLMDASRADRNAGMLVFNAALNYAEGSLGAALKAALSGGAAGTPGSQIHLMFSNDGGATFTNVVGYAVGKGPGNWLGIYSDYTVSDSSDPAHYTWVEIRGAQGLPGGTAKAMRLLATSQVFRIAKDGTVTPASIDLTALGQNVAGNPAISVTAGNATLTGSGATRSLAFAGMQSDTVTLQATWDGMTDTVTLAKVREGADAYVALLSNEAAVVASDATGAVASYAQAGGTMQVLRGAQLLGVGAVAFGVVAQTGVSVSMDASTGVYSVASMSADTGSALLRAVVANGPTFELVYSIAKSRAGQNGGAAKALRLLATSQVFRVAKDGTASPSSIDLTALGQNVAGAPVISVISGNATLTGSGSTRSLTFGGMQSDTVAVQATWDGMTDTMTIAKVREGSDAYIALLSNEAAVVAADASGAVASFGQAGGTMQVLRGAQLLSAGSVVFSVATQTGVSVSVDASTGVYAVASMSADSGSAVLRAVVTNGPTFELVFNIAKSRAGQAGLQGPASVSAMLSSYSVTLPAYADGVLKSLAGAEASMTVLQGGVDDSGAWSFTHAKSNAAIGTSIGGSPAGRVVTITSIPSTLDSGWVELTAARSGFAAMVQRFNFSKAKEAVASAGPVAAPGLMAVAGDGVAPGSATATLEFRGDGTIWGNGEKLGDWYLPTTSNIGAAYEVLLVQSGGSGTMTTNAGAWANVAGVRSASLTFNSNSAGIRTAGLQYAVRRASDHVQVSGGAGSLGVLLE